MTKMNSVLKIWSKVRIACTYIYYDLTLGQDGVLQRTIVRKRPIQSIRWIPDGLGTQYSLGQMASKF